MQWYETQRHQQNRHQSKSRRVGPNMWRQKHRCKVNNTIAIARREPIKLDSTPQLFEAFTRSCELG